MTFSLDVRAHSEIGLVRNNNQDSAYTSPTMLVVADGMGGAAAGDLASAVAIRELRRVDEQVHGGERISGEAMLEVAAGALSKANDRLAELVVNDHSLEGMGTTVCGALFDGEQLGLCHIGDSRAYLLRGGQLRQLTHDHSWVQSLVDEGKITSEEAANHPHRSLLLKVLNGQPTHSPDFELVSLQEGDRLLFCSDGLAGMVAEGVIDAIMLKESLTEVLTELVQAAYKGGGLDNISIVLADVVAQSDALDSVPAQVLGAAAEVKIPKISALRGIDLANPTRLDRTGATNRVAPVPTAPAPQIGGEPPANAIDPDRYESIRYSPRLPTRRRRLLPALIAVAAALALIVAGLLGANQYLKSQFFIGPESGNVAVFQGVSTQVLGHPLYKLVERTGAELEFLPPYRRDKVENGSLRYTSLTDAKAQATELADIAAACKAEKQGQSSIPQDQASTPPTPGSTPPSTIPPSSTPPSATLTTPASPASSGAPTLTPASPSTPQPSGVCA